MSYFDAHRQQPQQGPTMQQLQRDPAAVLRGAGYNVPADVAKNPQSAAMYLLRSGQVANPIMQRVQPMLQRLGVKL